MNVLSLFSGIGGPDLAAQAAGMTTVGFVEWDPWCQQILHQHWPDVPVWGDIREFTKEAYDERRGTIAFSDAHGGMATDGRECALAAGEGIGGRNDRTGSDSNDWQVANGESGQSSEAFSGDSTKWEGCAAVAYSKSGKSWEPSEREGWQDFGRRSEEGRTSIDLITGGFPCQPFSTAGKRRGTADTRYLWPEMLRVIEEFHPTWVVGENVAGFVGMGLDIALAGLESQGYEATAFVLPALAAGAPHRRDRCFIVAHSNSVGRLGGEPGQHRTDEDDTTCAGFATGGGDGGEGSLADTPELLGDGKHDHAGSCERPEAVSEPGDGRGAEDVADISSARVQGGTVARNDGENGSQPHDQFTVGCSDDGEPGSSEPRLGGTAHGLSSWLDKVREQACWQGDWEGETPRVTTERCDVANRLKALGNACVPSQIYPIFQAIAAIEAEAELEAAA